MNLAGLADALADPNVQAFLRVIRAGEGTADADGYRRCFGGDLFDGFADHPRRLITRGRYTSTAAGCFQFLSRTWDGLVKQYGFADFSPANQDLAAVALIAGRGALADVLSGRIPEAIARCSREWASLPGSPYGQPVRTMAQALATYAEHGGTLVAAITPDPIPPAPALASAITPETAPPEPAMPLPLIIGALLPSLIEAIPKLGMLFGSGSAVQERNVKAAELAVQIVQDATGARNAQEAVDMVRSDPAAAQAAIAAVEAGWYSLTEAGGGGIDGARKADAAAVAGGWRPWESPSFLALALLIPLVYIALGAVVGLWGSLTLNPEVTASIITGIVTLIVGSAAGFYFGSTTTRNKPGGA